MKFVIPQNYDFSGKLFGIIDYSTVILDVVWCVLVFCVVGMFAPPMYVRLFVMIVLCFPVVLFSVIGFNHENVLYVLMYMYKFWTSQKLYLYE